MAEPARNADADASQSMEEILQSIRRIIAEETDPAAENAPQKTADKAAVAAPAPAAQVAAEASVPPPAQAPATEDILELTDIVDDALPPPVAATPATQTPPAPPPATGPAEGSAMARAQAPSADEDDLESLLSPQTANAAAAPLRALADAAHRPAAEPVPLSGTTAPAFRSGNTVEDLVMEALRPMLQEWLNTNLPAMVTRIVEREVRKISGT